MLSSKAHSSGLFGGRNPVPRLAGWPWRQNGRNVAAKVMHDAAGIVNAAAKGNCDRYAIRPQRDAETLPADYDKSMKFCSSR
jgi:hypothetical protein